jgi:hypothetical protein
MEYLVSKLGTESDENVRFRLIHAITALVRGNTRARRLWEEAQGRTGFLNQLSDLNETTRTKLRILTFFSDIYDYDEEGESEAR